ncbi:MAG: VOC family protein [Cocleimonas sp.]
MINEAMFVIAVPDLERSADYYKNMLGFQVEEIGDPGWRKYSRDNCHIMAGNCPDAIPPNGLGDHSYFCYLVVESANDYYAELIVNKAEISKPPEDKPWQMREFAITTIDGHRIMVGERL